MTLIRSERQTFRAIQEHILMQRRRAGAAYTQLSTVGVIFHPDSADADLNLVTPHQGVAWTRGEDLRQGFQLLEARHRIPRLQYLSGLFPDAFARQLGLYGLGLESSVPIWLYSPIQGPFPPNEKPYGRLSVPNHQALEIEIEVVENRSMLANWLRIYRSANYGVELTQVDPDELDMLADAQKYNEAVFILGYYHNTPMAALRAIIGFNAAELGDPEIIWPWAGLGFEEALTTFTVNLLLEHGIETIYLMGDGRQDSNMLMRLGFVQSTQLLTYVHTAQL